MALVTIPPQLWPFAISSTVHAVSNFFNAFKIRRQQFEISRFNAEQQEKLEDRRQKIQLAQMKQHYLQHQENLDFQARQSQLNREHQTELEAFRQQVNLMINDRNLEFQTWRWEQEQALQSELASYNRETQQLIASYQRETARQLPEVNKLYETWPLRIVPSQILKENHNAIQPLKVIIAPPEIDFDKFAANTNTGVPKLEKSLAEGLRQFFSQYYPLNHDERPVEFLGGAWDAKRFHGETSIKALFSMLNSEPILVIESEIDGDFLNIRFAYWTPAQSSYHYASVVTGFRYRELIYESAKKRAKEWKSARDLLLKQGKDPKVINAIDTYNLEILEEEEQLAQLGVDINQLPPRYKLQTSDFEVLSQFLKLNHCLIAGLISDAYHLLQHDTFPILPHYLQDLVIEESSFDLIKSIVKSYQQLLQTLHLERPAFASDIAMNLALEFAQLEDKQWAKLLLMDSINYWLIGHGISPCNNLEDHITTVNHSLSIANADYVKKLEYCLKLLEEDSDVALFSKALTQTKQQALAEFVSTLICEEAEKEEYINIYQQAIEGIVEAQHKLGEMYLEGEGIEKDQSKAFKWFKLAAEQGNDDAQMMVGVLYLLDEEIEQDYSKAFKWLSLAAEQNSDAQYMLGQMYEKGEGIEQDHSKALCWYTLAAEKNPTAQAVLGIFYYSGHIVEQDYSKAFELFSLATEQNSNKSHVSDAQYMLGRMYYEGKGIEQDYSKALKWLNLAAEQGEAMAQRLLGIMYDEGKGVEQNYSEAFKWLKLAAEQKEDPDLQNRIGEMYLKGQGIEQNYAEAVKWFKLAAEQEYAMAQRALGIMYLEGNGVKQSDSKAFKWLKLAAKQGDAYTQDLLGRLYCIKKANYIKGYKWLKLSAQQGNTETQEYLMKLYLNKKILEDHFNELYNELHELTDLNEVPIDATPDSYNFLWEDVELPSPKLLASKIIKL